MLENKPEILLKIILNLIEEDNEYKIINKSEFLSRFKKRHKVTPDILKEMLQEIDKHEYISLKYVDDTVVGLSVLNKGRFYFNKSYNEKREIQKLRKIFFFYTILAGLSAFAGTAIAILLFLRS